MRTYHRSLTGRAARWSVPLLASLCLVSACTTSNGARTGRIDIEGPAGFTITEEGRVGSRARGDFERAIQALQEERFEEGIALLEAVTEAAPEATTAHLDLGIAYRKVGDFDRAAESLEKALALHPRHPVAQNELGIVYRKQGRFEEARASYEAALAVYPDFHFARRNLAILCDVYLGDLACAVEHYERYLQVSPEDESVAMWLTDLQNRMGR